jgi:hypothetical protein
MAMAVARPYSVMDYFQFVASFVAALFTRVLCFPYTCLSFSMNALKPAPTVLEAFEYTPLDTKEANFRLLKLLRRKERELECELLPQSLSGNEHIPYEAMSYASGSSDLVETILLDGCQYWITEDLHSALQSLRLDDRDRFLWVDAICINQADEKERSQQVQQIAKIYSNADKVLIWLGKATSEMASLMDALEQFRKNDPYRIPGHWPIDNSVWKTHRTGLLQLLERPWFSRMWSLQDAANAKHADVCCGAWSIPAEIFTLAPSLVGEVPLLQCQSVLDVMTESSRVGSWWAQKRDLSTLLRKFQTYKTSDERDKIYALLGMSTDAQDLQSLVIDYQKPTHRVVHEAVTYLLQPRSSTESTPTPTAIYEILNLMNTFKTVQTTYFVPASAQEGSTETIYLRLQSGGVLSESQASKIASQTLEVSTDSELFLFEEKNHYGQDTCYSQVLKLMSASPTTTSPQDEQHDDGLQVLPWGSVSQNVKIVVIHDKKKAVLQAASQGCHYVVKELLRIKTGTSEDEPAESAELLEAVEQGEVVAEQAELELDSDVKAEEVKPFDGAVSAVSRKGNMKMLKMLLSVGISAPQC